MHVMAKGRELLHTYDALLAEEKDAANRQKLMQQANNAIAEMLKKETQDTLDKVLFELSSQMKMHIHVRMHDREGHNREKERKWNADRFSFIISTGL